MLKLWSFDEYQYDNAAIMNIEYMQADIRHTHFDCF